MARNAQHQMLNLRYEETDVGLYGKAASDNIARDVIPGAPVDMYQFLFNVRNRRFPDVPGMSDLWQTRAACPF